MSGIASCFTRENSVPAKIFFFFNPLYPSLQIADQCLLPNIARLPVLNNTNNNHKKYYIFYCVFMEV